MIVIVIFFKNNFSRILNDKSEYIFLNGRSFYIFAKKRPQKRQSNKSENNVIYHNNSLSLSFSLCTSGAKKISNLKMKHVFMNDSNIWEKSLLTNFTILKNKF